MKRTQWLALLTALVLTLSLLAGCGSDSAPAPAEPAPATDAGEKEPAPVQPETQPAEPSADKEEAPLPDAAPQTEEPTEQPEELPQPEEQSAPSADPAPVEQPEPVPAPVEDDPPAQPEEDAAPDVLADGTYTASVTLEGGTGRASVASPAVLRCEGGKIWATIVWSSSNYDYMKVDGEKYELVSTEGNSTFEIPVAAFDQKLDVIADTVAMSEPHEIEYTLYFDSASLAKQ